MLLDPVYSGNAMTGTIDLIRNGDLAKDETIVFLHPGGVVGMFSGFVASPLKRGNGPSRGDWPLSSAAGSAPCSHRRDALSSWLPRCAARYYTARRL
jgi:hypothetical protein